jgi:methionyl-tRNA synthetase
MSLYLTTPIFYVNARPHLGHAYTAIAADTVCRFKRSLGEEVFFQTGTDEHGDKVVQAATEAGLSPREYSDQISAKFREAWPALTIEPDRFIRTTDPEHISTVQGILQKVYDSGDIYFSDYTGLYCQGCERFLTEKELVDSKCPDHQKEPVLISEQNYFFRMSNYREWLIEHIRSHPDFITPERYRNEVLSFLKEPLEDLCISRPVSRLSWGIPLPFDDRFVTYVWFDALINYLTGIGYPAQPGFASRWAAAEHLIAKDILKPHAIYWPTMLKAMGLSPFRRLHVHGYWNLNETKMSKSIGNVVRPTDLAAEYGADVVRYFLLREMAFGVDASFSTEALIGRQNADLANDLGNLFSRSLAMVAKFADSRVPTPGASSPEDRELAAAAIAMLADYKRHMEQFAFHRALQSVWEVIGLANRYIVTNAPWELAKRPEQAERLGTVLFHLLEILRLLALVLQPIMPGTAAKMAAVLGTASPADFPAHGRWGLLEPGNALQAAPALFPRHDKEKNDAVDPVGSLGSGPKKGGGEKGVKKIDMEPNPEVGLISFDDFGKLDLRVGIIVAAEKVPKSERLLKLTVKAPEERTVVAGIAEYYQPEQVIGQEVLLVANLKPVKLMGILSQGMVLAARDGERLVLTKPGEPVSPGSKVS